MFWRNVWKIPGCHFCLRRRDYYSKKDYRSREERESVTGKVTDEKKEPLPGVTVIIKGTKLGTVTDVDGKYTLAVPVGNNALVFSMIGMKQKEEVIGKRTQIDVVMEEEISELEDVVVTGYYTQAKNSFTGAAGPSRQRSCRWGEIKIS